MSSTSNVPNVTSRLHDPSQPPPAVGTTAGPGTVHPSQPKPTGTTLPQRSEAQDIPGQQGRNAFNSERPLDVRPAPEGGVAMGGQSSLPQGHATMADKIVGKMEKVIGKVMSDEEKHEKGELRETGGKAAAEGRARAAHD